VFQRYASGRYTLSDLRDYISKATDTTNRPQTRAGIHNLLKNPTYTGINRHGYYSRSKIQVKSQDEKLADVVEVEDCHAALIDKATFQNVQERLESNRPDKSGRAHPAFLFTGLLWCACGARYSAYRHSGGGKAVYYCTRRNNAGSCDSRSVYEPRIRESVLGPIEHLLSQLNQQDVRAAVRANLLETDRQERAKAQAGKHGLGDKLARLEKRLTTWLEMVGDGELPRSEYAKLRAEVEPQIAELQSQLAAQPHLALPDMEQFFALADALAGEPPDDTEWRGLVEGMVDRITISGHDINVVWKPEFQSLVEGVAEA
jgi:hypothetical protein